MREIRTSGSEGGEAPTGALPTSIFARLSGFVVFPGEAEEGVEFVDGAIGLDP